MRIDAHQHYWNIARGDYGWIQPDNALMYRDYGPADLIPHLKKHGIDQTILVQAAPTVEETLFLLELSQDEPTVAAVVGWVDVTTPDYKQQIEAYAKYDKFAGIRVMIQDMPDETVILSEPYVEAFQYLEEINLPVDLLVTHGQLSSVVTLMAKVPKLRAVIDHIAKPNIAEQSFDEWFQHMKQLAAYPSLYCKASGMITEAAEYWKVDDFKRYLDAVLELFGIDRLMFGSDWPVCLMAGSYDDTVKVVMDNLGARLEQGEWDRLFGLNASVFYKLGLEG